MSAAIVPTWTFVDWVSSFAKKWLQQIIVARFHMGKQFPSHMMKVLPQNKCSSSYHGYASLEIILLRADKMTNPK